MDKRNLHKEHDMPTDLLSIATETALKEYRAGQCIPHEVIIESVRKEMGWK